MPNMYNNNGMGVYTYGSQFDLDPIRMKSMGFTQEEIQALTFIVNNEGKAAVSTMVQYYGIPYEEAQKLKYMYDICTGRIVINSEDDISKHLRKMFGRHRRIGIQDLSTSTISEIPRAALIAGIPKDTPFAIWNSINYPKEQRLYRVIDTSGQNIIIETDRIPKLKYKEAKKIDNMLEIKEDPVNGKMKVAVNKEYCRMCNRFIIVASLRRPEFHHGLISIICMEGTKVYIYADTLAPNKNSRYYNATQRVYDFGFFPNEIGPKLLNCATMVYQRVCGVYASQLPANMDFIMLPVEQKEDDDIQID